MVNSKKMSKSSIAVIVLSILLVLSLILGFTGAWFTDKLTSGEEGTKVTFGHVELNDGKAIAITAPAGKVMPGDKLTVTNTQYKGAAAYYKLVVTATCDNAELQSSLNTTFGAGAKYGVIAASEEFADLTLLSDITIDAKTFGNTYQDAVVTLSVELTVIQQQNQEIGENAANTPEAAKYVFENLSGVNFETGLQA